MPLALLPHWQKNIKPMVIGTTGHDKDDRLQLKTYPSSIPMVWAGNFSTGLIFYFFLLNKQQKYWI
jgi:dihydrodipicolinate reductase